MTRLLLYSPRAGTTVLAACTALLLPIAGATGQSRAVATELERAWLISRDAPGMVSSGGADGPTTIQYGLLGGAAGMLGGGLAGIFLAGVTNCDSNFCGTSMIVAGALAGESAGIAIGVHKARGQRGRLEPRVLGSLAVGILGATIVHQGQWGSQVTVAALLITPAVQIVASRFLECCRGQ